eukprot:c4681_g1_i1.p1 GENE.c4681_g1_i1~~c4681_g1_i1.p1  ORF type:complete len:288 (+),score=57.63 c4681_g1_i1:45-908(+)
MRRQGGLALVAIAAVFLSCQFGLLYLYKSIESHRVCECTRSMLSAPHKPSHLKLAIVTVWDDGVDPDVVQISLSNKRRYAALHNYTFIDASRPGVKSSLPTAWLKLSGIKLALETHDAVVWMDIDTLIMNHGIKFEWFLEGLGPNKDIVMTQDMRGPNSGVFISRSSAWTNWFLDEWLSQSWLAKGDYVFHYEQRALHFLLQTPFWQSNHPRLKYSGDPRQIASHFTFLSQCCMNSNLFDRPLSLAFFKCLWNNCVEMAQYHPGNFIVHLAGHTHADKTRLMKELAA